LEQWERFEKKKRKEHYTWGYGPCFWRDENGRNGCLAHKKRRCNEKKKDGSKRKVKKRGTKETSKAEQQSETGRKGGEIVGQMEEKDRPQKKENANTVNEQTT